MKLETTKFLVMGGIRSGEIPRDGYKVYSVMGTDWFSLVEFSDPAPTLKENWKQLRDKLPTAAQIMPIYSDGKKYYSTNDVDIRFTEALSGKEMNAFAGNHALELLEPIDIDIPDGLESAKFREATFCFDHNSGCYFFPDILEQIKEDDVVESAYPSFFEIDLSQTEEDSLEKSEREELLEAYQKEMEKVHDLAQRLDAFNPTLPFAFTGCPSERIERQLRFYGVNGFDDDKTPVREKERQFLIYAKEPLSGEQIESLQKFCEEKKMTFRLI